MPFTLAHPAAVLPLRRARLLRTVPLMIGAMTPDVPYYLPWRITKYIPDTTHTALGTFTVDLPIGLLLLLVIWLLRAPLAAPPGGSASTTCLAALERFGSRPGNWVLAPLSILVGAWTHLAWDSFTHADGWMVSRISALSAPVSFFSYTGELCHVLQYVSSVLGLLVLAIWFYRLPAPAPQRRNAERSSGGPLLLALLFIAAAAAGGFETLEHLMRHIPARYHIFYLLLTRTMAWFALLYTLAGLLIVRGRRRGAATATG
ncbi:MAG TPA: DUF4184 family protein [Steroidobacteraceae bacterium]|nr:DUF4184 family protein [Steroidobacteraceae bacterium]